MLSEISGHILEISDIVNPEAGVDVSAIESLDNNVIKLKRETIMFRPDDDFLRSNITEFATANIEHLANNIYDWKQLSKNNKYVYCICLGLGLFHYKERRYIHMRYNLQYLREFLYENHTGLIFETYVRCLRKFVVKYSNVYKTIVPFSHYFFNVAFQYIGKSILNMIDIKLKLKNKITEYSLSDLDENTGLEMNVSKMAEISGMTRRALQYYFCRHELLYNNLASTGYLKGRNK